MQAPYSLLWLDRRRSPVWQQPLFPQPAQPPFPEIADASPWTAYRFRPGGYWPPQVILTPPSGVAAPDQRAWVEYPFRAGGFWQVQKFWLYPAPAVVDVAAPNQSPWAVYRFRPGGLWLVQPFRLAPVVQAPAIVIPPSAGAPFDGGGRKLDDDLWDWEQWQRRNRVRLEQDVVARLAVMLTLGLITPEEFVALAAAA